MGTTMGTNTSAVQPMPCWPPPVARRGRADVGGRVFRLPVRRRHPKRKSATSSGSLHSRLLDTIVLLPGQESMHVRASGGISWYPDDSADYEELIRYADFAMYKVKRTDKGRFKEFDRRDLRPGTVPAAGQRNAQYHYRAVPYPVPVPAHCGCRDG